MSNAYSTTVTRGLPIIDIGKDDININGQIYMGENKVLSFVVTDSWS